MEIEFRKADPADAELLIEIYNASFYSDYLRYGECPAYGRTAETMRRSIIDYPKFLIVCGGRPVGCISCREVENSVYEVGCLCVIPEYQGKGIGTAAMEFAKSHYSDWTRFTLITPVDKTENVRFYKEKCGFAIQSVEMDGNVSVARFVLERQIPAEERRKTSRTPGQGGIEMDYQTKDLILHFVTAEDLSEVARTWPADHHPLSDAEAREAIASMRGNYGRNAKGCIYHLCLAVCGKERPGTIMGWCGLDGSRNHAEPEIFILLDEPYRGKGYGTQCVRELLRIAVEDYSLSSVHGGCAKENIASARAMEKGGMVRYGAEENGDPLFRFCAETN